MTGRFVVNVAHRLAELERLFGRAANGDQCLAHEFEPAFVLRNDDLTRSEYPESSNLAAAARADEYGYDRIAFPRGSRRHECRTFCASNYTMPR